MHHRSKWGRTGEILATLVFLSGCAARPAEMRAENSPATNESIPAGMSKYAVVAIVNRYARAVSSFDAQYVAQWKQCALMAHGRKVPDLHRDDIVREIDQGPCVWIDVTDRMWSQKDAEAPAIDENSHTVEALDGECISVVSPERQEAMVLKWKKDQSRASSALRYRDFLATVIPNQLGSGPGGDPDPLPDLLSFVNDPDAKLMGDRILVDGRSCYHATYCRSKYRSRAEALRAYGLRNWRSTRRWTLCRCG